MKKVRESAVERELVRRVEALGGICDKIEFVGKRGCFDRIVVLPRGKIILVELKRPKGGVVSPHQEFIHRQYRALGAHVVVVKNVDDVDALLT